ncbi:MAG TPA: aminotransferase class IV [Paludibacteraceae bacterium]|nr:aminotransferase class IV [Paludibacteraceae bacterium]HOS36622.1 aminotransferase class IV [Paludibacteraceae bacterium]HPK19793.1 aminotransferase class IV [Paludibacteraceae bacterium]
MSHQFTEAIKYKDGKFYNLSYHQLRMDKTSEHFGLNKINLAKNIEKVPSPDKKGFYKCRVLYVNEIESIEFLPYSFRKKQKVGIVQADEIDYSYKYANREKLEKLIAGTDFDDIIIVKNGYVTDALFSNLVFETEKGLFTPKTFLLPGTKRQYLLDKQVISETTIRAKDIFDYSKIRFINSMIDIEDDIFIETKKLIL